MKTTTSIKAGALNAYLKLTGESQGDLDGDGGSSLPPAPPGGVYDEETGTCYPAT